MEIAHTLMLSPFTEQLVEKKKMDDPVFSRFFDTGVQLDRDDVTG
jgi:hypothetical protein